MSHGHAVDFEDSELERIRAELLPPAWVEADDHRFFRVKTYSNRGTEIYITLNKMMIVDNLTKEVDMVYRIGETNHVMKVPTEYFSTLERAIHYALDRYAYVVGFYLMT